MNQPIPGKLLFEKTQSKLKNTIQGYMAQNGILKQNVRKLNLEMEKLKETSLEEEKQLVKNTQEI